MAISPTLRFHILERDGFACQYCGTRSPEADLEVDHIKPTSLGGTDAADNLVVACKTCNIGKGARLVSDEQSNDDIRARLAYLRERRALLVKCGKAQDEIIDIRWAETWRILRLWLSARGQDESGGASWAISTAVRSLLARYPFDEVLKCVDITLARHFNTRNETTAIRYLYGVVRNRQDDAISKEGS